MDIVSRPVNQSLSIVGILNERAFVRNFYTFMCAFVSSADGTV